MNPVWPDANDLFFCVCEEEDCFCLNQITRAEMDPAELEKIKNHDLTYIIPCATCKAGTHVPMPHGEDVASWLRKHLMAIQGAPARRGRMN